MRLSQTSFVVALLQELDRQYREARVPRPARVNQAQMNAVIEAASFLVRALDPEPSQPLAEVQP